MKCPLCESRKGKRFCPAKQTQICAQCCGEKRVVEIACPVDCRFLHQGEDFQRYKNHMAQLASLEHPQERLQVLQTLIHFSGVLEELEKKVVEYATGLRTLQDRHVGEAIALLRKNYRTESRGIIYEEESANPLVQGLSRDLRDTIEGLRKDLDAESPLRLEGVLNCLRVLELNVTHYGKSGGSGYLNFIRRSHPEQAGKPDQSEGLITL